MKTKCLNDNFMYIQNLVNSLHHKRKPALPIKLDIARAFDFVSWEFILELLREMGFSVHWRDLIALLLSSTSSCFLVNGALGVSVRHHRVLRQGEPLSPLLFILAIDTLHRLIDKVIEDGILAPLPGREVKLCVSLYADNVVIFANPGQKD